MGTCKSLFRIRRSKRITNVTFPTNLVVFALNINQVALNNRLLVDIRPNLNAYHNKLR